MKTLRNSTKKTKYLKRKSKSSEKSLISVNQALWSKENLNLEEANQEGLKNGSWLQENEKNEKELQAVKDLCALSEEDGISSFENNFEKLWMDSNKAPDKNLTANAKENKLCNPSLTTRWHEDIENRSHKNKNNVVMISRLEVANILQSRNFFGENMPFRAKKDGTKDKELLGQEQFDKLLLWRENQIPRSLKDLKENEDKRDVKGESRKTNNKRITEKYFLRTLGNTRETSRQETNNAWQESFKEGYKNETGLFPKGVKIKIMDALHLARSRSSRQVGLNKSHISGRLRQEILELIQKFKKANKRMPRESKDLEIKRTSDIYAEDCGLYSNQSANDTEFKEAETHMKPTRVRLKIQGRESVTSMGKSIPELESQGLDSQQEFNECLDKIGLGFSENRIQIHPKEFYKRRGEKGQYAVKPPLSFRQQKKGMGDEKVLVIKKDSIKDAYKPKRNEKYSVIAKEIPSLSHSIVYGQIDSSKELQSQHYQYPENYIINSSNTLNQDRPETANLESPERRNIMRTLNYFRNSRQFIGKKFSRNASISPRIKTTNRTRSRKEVISMPKLEQAEILINMRESLKIVSKEKQYRRLSLKQNSLISMKVEGSATSRNFRDNAINTLQKGTGRAFLEAKGEKLN